MPDVQVITDIFNQILSSKPEILLTLFIIALGYTLKSIAVFPNRFIPLMNLLIGGIVYPLISSPGNVDYAMRYPIVRQVICGLIIGCAAHYIHALFLKKWLDKYLPLADQDPPADVPKP